MQFERLKLLVNNENFEKLSKSIVVVLGVGGVGSYAAEALARSNVGTIILFDNDNIELSNINRQIHALNSTVGKAKVEVMKDRILDINPSCNVIIHKMFYTEKTYETLFKYKIDFLIDAIDTITFKIHVIKECLKRDIKFISCMGQARKFHPEKIEITDIRKTTYCPVAKVIRNKLKKERIKGMIPVVYSKEIPLTQNQGENLASNAYVPSVAGLICASYVVNNIVDHNDNY